MIGHFEQGRMEEAAQLQHFVTQVINVISRHGGNCGRKGDHGVVRIALRALQVTPAIHLKRKHGHNGGGTEID